jgi:hypothetical protein
MARQLVKSTVNLDLMMLAGQKPNSGAMIGALGGILSEALDAGNKAKGDREKADLVKLQEKGEAERAQQDKIDNAGETASKGLEGLGVDLTGNIDLPGFGGRGLKNSTGSVFVGQGEFGLVPDSGAQKFNGGGLVPYNKQWDRFTIAQKNSYASKEDYIKEQKNLGKSQLAEKDARRKYAESLGIKYDEAKHEEAFLNSEFNIVKSPGTRLKDDNPLKRRQVRGSRQSFNSPDAQSFNANVNAAGKEPVGSRDTSSQYTKGKTFVEKRRTIQMHSSLGELGQAAAEGWNISVERDNYEKQIAADLKDFRNDEWKDAEEQSDKNALMDRGMVESMGSLRTAFGQAQQLKDPKQRATATAAIETKMGNLKRDNNEIQTQRKFLAENKNKVAWDLIKPERVAQILGIEGGSGTLGITMDEGGNMFVAGAGPGNTPMKMNSEQVRKLMQDLPMKRDFHESAIDIAQGLKDEKFQIKAIDENGIKTSKNVPFSQFKKQVAGRIEALIFTEDDPTGKGIASGMPAFQGKDGHRAWEEGMKYPEYQVDPETGVELRDENGERVPEPLHPYNIIRENLMEATYNDMGGYEAARDESVTSMYTNQQAEKSRIAKENREKNRTNNDSRTTLDNYNEYLDNAFGAYGSEGIEITQGNMEYLKGLPGVSDVQYVPAVYGNDKTMISKPTLTLLDKGGSPIIDKVDLTDEETARNIMLKYMGEKKFKPATRDTKTGGYNGAQVNTQTDHQKLTNQYAPK